MQKKKKKSLNDKIEDIVSNNTIWVFLGFILVVIILPRFLLEKSFLGYVPNDPKIDPSSIINNLTTPIIGLFSAFLVYIAFRAQIKANKELQKQNEFLLFDKYKMLVNEMLLNIRSIKIEYINKDEDPYLNKSHLSLLLNYFNEFTNLSEIEKDKLLVEFVEKYEDKIDTYYSLATTLINQITNSKLSYFEKRYLLSLFEDYNIQYTNNKISRTISSFYSKDFYQLSDKDFELKLNNKIDTINNKIIPTIDSFKDIYKDYTIFINKQ